MADKKISELAAAVSVGDTDQVEVLQLGDNKRGAFSIIKSYLQAAFDALYVPLTRTLTINGDAQTLAADRSWTIATGAEVFTDLTDVPASYTGEGNKVVSVKGTEDGLEFIDQSFTPGNLSDAGTDGITITGGTNAVNGAGTSLSQHVADTTHNGYLSSTDWNTFNGKSNVEVFTDLNDVPSDYTGDGSKLVAVKATEDGLEFVTAPAGSFTPADLTDVGTDGITITGGTNAVNGAGTAISQHVADSTHNGYLSSTDWNTFNAKSDVAAFTDLNDVPADYTGDGSKLVAVKSSEDGLEFVANPGATTNQRTGVINFGDKRNSGISTGVLPFAVLSPCDATIVGWWVRVDAACTIKFRKRASALEPGTGDRINTSGLSVSSGITKSTTLTDFTTTAISSDDVIIPELTSITGTLTSFETGLLITKT